MDKRHQYIERSIEATDQLLRNDPYVARWLGPRAIELANVANDLFIPNIRHGKVQFPKEYQDTEKVPVVALRPGFRLWAQRVLLPPEACRLTPAQRDTATQFLIEYGYRGSAEERIDSIDKRLDPRANYLSRRQGAMVCTDGLFCNQASGLFEDRRIQAYQIWGRPVLALAYKPKLPGLYPALMTHEYVHLLQAKDGYKAYEGSDIAAERQRYTDQMEHEAYADGAKVTLAQTEAGRTGVSEHVGTQIAKWSTLSAKLYPDQPQMLGPYYLPPDHPSYPYMQR